MTKQFRIKLFLFLTFLLVFIFPILIVSAATGTNLNYDPMEVLPGFAKTADFSVFISNLYKFGIWTVGICALIMIVIGGYMYAASGGNNASMEKAKTFITDALIGLILALLAYLILYIINPELVKIKMGGAGITGAITAPPIKPANCTGTPPTNSSPCSTDFPLTPTDITLVETCIPTELCSYKCNGGYKIEGSSCVSIGAITSASLQEAAATASASATFSNSGDCKDAGGTAVSPSSSLSQAKTGMCSTTCNSTCKSNKTPCTACNKLGIKLLDAISTVGKTTPITVSSLTGGQHTSNTSIHYSGKAADIVPSSTRSEWPSIVSQFISAGCSSFCDKGGSPVSCTAADHIHVTCQ